MQVVTPVTTTYTAVTKLSTTPTSRRHVISVISKLLSYCFMDFSNCSTKRNTWKLGNKNSTKSFSQVAEALSQYCKQCASLGKRLNPARLLPKVARAPSQHYCTRARLEAAMCSKFLPSSHAVDMGYLQRPGPHNLPSSILFSKILAGL